MKKFVSIKKKLIINTMVTISLIFMVVLTVVIIKDIIYVNKSIRKSEHNIRNSIIAKGNTLANNNSMAMRGMAEDNAFTAIQNLVSSTVKDDPDIAYGIYMDIDNMAWAWAVDSVYRMPDVFHADSVLPKQPASDRIQLNTDRKQFICRVVQ